MDLEGTIVQEFPMVEGVSKAGNAWKKKEYLMEYPSGNYTNRLCFTVFGDRATTLTFEVGKRYIVSFDVTSREYNGRWFTEARSYAARSADAQAYQAPAPAPQQGFQPAPGMPQQPAADPFAPAASDTDDLPF